MKRFFAAVAFFALGMTACAHSQVSPTPPQYTAPAAGNGAYTPLNPPSNTANPPTASLNYKDSGLSAEECYVVQGYMSTGAQYSNWSNTACSAPGPTGGISLAWTCTVPSPNPNNLTCTGITYVVSRAAAVVAAGPAVPTQGAPTSSELVAPQLDRSTEPQTASKMPAPLDLKAVAAR